MITRNIIILAALIVGTGAVHAQRSGTGVGAIIGEPTGGSVKHWVSENQAVDAAIGWSFDRDTTFHIHADWLWHDFDMIPVDRGSLPVYVGVGARFKSGKDRDGPPPSRGTRDRFGIRVPVGVAYHFDDLPLEIFGEIVPILDVSPSSSVRLNAAVGARWYFR